MHLTSPVRLGLVSRRLPPFVPDIDVDVGLDQSFDDPVAGLGPGRDVKGRLAVKVDPIDVDPDADEVSDAGSAVSQGCHVEWGEPCPRVGGFVVAGHGQQQALHVVFMVGSLVAEPVDWIVALTIHGVLRSTESLIEDLKHFTFQHLHFIHCFRLNILSLEYQFLFCLPSYCQTLIPNST